MVFTIEVGNDQFQQRLIPVTRDSHIFLHFDNNVKSSEYVTAPLCYSINANVRSTLHCERYSTSIVDCKQQILRRRQRFLHVFHVLLALLKITFSAAKLPLAAWHRVTSFFLNLEGLVESPRHFFRSFTYEGGLDEMECVGHYMSLAMRVSSSIIDWVHARSSGNTFW